MVPVESRAPRSREFPAVPAGLMFTRLVMVATVLGTVVTVSDADPASPEPGSKKCSPAATASIAAAAAAHRVHRRGGGEKTAGTTVESTKVSCGNSRCSMASSSMTSR